MSLKRWMAAATLAASALLVAQPVFAQAAALKAAKELQRKEDDAARKAQDAANKKEEAARQAAQEAASRYREGDSVCIRQWQGTGYCGNVDRVSGDRLKVEITKVDCGGWIGRCNGDPCSGGRTIGPKGDSSVSGVGDFVWTEKYCVTSR